MPIVQLRSKAASRLAVALGVSALTLAVAAGPTDWGSQKAYAQEVNPTAAFSVADSSVPTPTPLQRFMDLVAQSAPSGDNGKTGDGKQPAKPSVPSAPSHLASGGSQPASVPTAPDEGVAPPTPATAPAKQSGDNQPKDTSGSAVPTVPATPATAPVTPSPAPTVPATPSPAPTVAAAAPSPDPTAVAVGKRVGIQAGHWQTANMPDELASLRGSTGAAGSGWREVDVNLDIARRVSALLSNAGVQVDLLPSTIPTGYKADAFVALHNDGNSNTSLSGYKVARSSWSVIPTKDDALVKDLANDYEAGTGFAANPQTITLAMTRYYAFNNQMLQHAVAPSTPGAILEMSFLTNAGDRNVMTTDPDRVATAVANGILDFLNGK